MPVTLHPIVGRLGGAYLAFCKAQVGRHVLHEIRKRVQSIRPSVLKSATDRANDDVLQWIVEDAARRSDAKALGPWNVLGKIMLFSLFAQHTTYDIEVSSNLDHGHRFVPVR